jgi:hypothetical protein
MTQTASASTATTGLAAGDTFVFAANFGNVTLTNFDPETVVIEIDSQRVRGFPDAARRCTG